MEATTPYPVQPELLEFTPVPIPLDLAAIAYAEARAEHRRLAALRQDLETQLRQVTRQHDDADYVMREAQNALLAIAAFG